MLLLNVLCVVIVCALNRMTSAIDNAAISSRSFTAVKSTTDDDYVCAIPPGFLTTFQSASTLQCTSECQRSSPCGGFNVKENGSCELYSKNQAIFGLQLGCRFFSVSEVWMFGLLPGWIVASRHFIKCGMSTKNRHSPKMDILRMIDHTQLLFSGSLDQWYFIIFIRLNFSARSEGISSVVVVRFQSA